MKGCGSLAYDGSQLAEMLHILDKDSDRNGADMDGYGNGDDGI